MKKDERAGKLSEVEARGFSALRSGLGLPAGNYVFITPSSDDIYGIKEVESKKNGKKYALTIVAGTAKGIEETNKHIIATFGLGDRDRQLVVNVDDWNTIEPNQRYDLVVGDNGRISSISMAMEENVIETSKVISSKRKTVSV